MNSSVTECMRKGKLYSEYYTTGESATQNLPFSAPIDPRRVSFVLCTYCTLVGCSTRPRLNSSMFIHKYLVRETVRGGTRFDVHYSLLIDQEKASPTLLPSLRQHLSPFRQAGGFIGNKVLEKSLQSRPRKGRLCSLGRFCLLSRNAYHKF